MTKSAYSISHIMISALFVQVCVIKLFVQWINCCLIRTITHKKELTSPRLQSQSKPITTLRFQQLKPSTQPHRRTANLKTSITKLHLRALELTGIGFPNRCGKLPHNRCRSPYRQRTPPPPHLHRTPPQSPSRRGTYSPPSSSPKPTNGPRAPPSFGKKLLGGARRANGVSTGPPSGRGREKGEIQRPAMEEERGRGVGGG